MAEVTMTLEEYQDLEDKLSTLAMENHNLKKERDNFREQRDEIINDMADIKRKAEAFDLLNNSYTTEIEQAIRNKELNQCLFLLEQILDGLERGSDDNRN
ncbi:hypothetical protein [Staphylococcus haemolyticus]|uniref:hypothetical protein n=1 Tax=Staphylococcus haemolyticus TaxID=1283 RepID=UPI001C70EB6C